MNLPRTFVLSVERHIQRYDDTAIHLDRLGIKFDKFEGFDNQLTRLNPVDTFDLDRAGERIGPKHIAATLTHWACWKVCSYLPDEWFWILEYDARLVPDWRERYEQIMQDLPEDADMLYIGSCCTEGRETKHIKGDVYEVHWPLCGHGIQIHRRALPTLLREHQTIRMPLDIAMFHTSLRKLRVYTVKPALVTQHGTYAPP